MLHTNSFPKRWLLIFCALLALLPILRVVIALRMYAVNHLIAEEWYSTAPLAIAVHDGTFRLSQLFEPINEHFYFFTKLVIALTSNYNQFNRIFYQYVNVMLSITAFVIVILLLWNTDKIITTLAAPPISLLLFSFRQYENWFLVYQNIFIISSIFMLLAIMVIQFSKKSWRALFLAMLPLGAGSFSMNVAPLLWTAPLPMLWLRGYRNWRQYAVWLIAALVTNIFSLRGLSERFGTPPQLDQIGLLIDFTLSFIGNGFVLKQASELSKASVIGAFGLALFAANALLLWRHRPAWLASWASLAVFGVGASVATAYGRLFLFIEDSITPLEWRYVTHSSLFWCALAAICLTNVISWRKFPWSEGVSLQIRLLFKGLIYISILSGIMLIACSSVCKLTRNFPISERIGTVWSPCLQHAI